MDTEDWAFDTLRLRVGPWHDLADEADLDLVDVVTQVLTPSTTSFLPPEWQGRFDRARAEGWIAERDAESPTLLALRMPGEPVALMMLFAEHGIDGADLRVGYVVAPAAQGQGLATELVSGLVTHARHVGGIVSISGGVAPDNRASARVLVRAGFEHVGTTAAGEHLHRLDLR